MPFTRLQQRSEYPAADIQTTGVLPEGRHDKQAVIAYKTLTGETFSANAGTGFRVKMADDLRGRSSCTGRRVCGFIRFVLQPDIAPVQNIDCAATGTGRDLRVMVAGYPYPCLLYTSDAADE